ncbi:GIN domain-containing protein [Mucilaginibacter segetis]|uniref:DUF2807 domain-containing protein n=1 Tax=Mucilaginibacter segetis TaxID=2793071 RepID=A0A934PUA9_9SPHI|nr:DUF2807 domain-containing protein [Mucilaginibacter segetis]MBK0379220.1 DUF2807 domain-containing protein [Mucilaginibacter segetis]
MKKSNRLLLLFGLLFTAGIGFTDEMLAVQYRHIDLNDPYKNFSAVTIHPFRVLAIRGGNGYIVRVMQGDSFRVMLMNSRKPFFRLEQRADTAFIRFSVANQQYQSPEECTTGLIITVPHLAALRLSGINGDLTGLSQDSLLLSQQNRSLLRVKRLNVERLSLRATGSSATFFQDDNQTETLWLDLAGGSSADLGSLHSTSIFPHLQDDSRLSVTTSSLTQLKSDEALKP